MAILLLDMDGTLVNTERDLAQAVNHTLESMGHPPRTLDEVRAFIGNGATALLMRALASEEASTVEKARQRFFDYYDEHLLDHSHLYDGWAQVLDSEIPLVIATNKPERFAKKIVQGLGLSGRFLAVVGGDTLPTKKPDPQVARHISNLTGYAVHDFIIVGDGVPDGQLATNSGFPFWAAGWGFGQATELASYSAEWLDRPEDILKHLKERDNA